MSKSSARVTRLEVRYWSSRIFRNSYTRRGRRYRVRGWHVKIQVGGRRRTYALRATPRGAAAAEALALYRSLIGDVEAAREATGAPSEAVPAAVPERIHLVQRPHAPRIGSEAGWSVWLETDGLGDYYPLATPDATEAARRAHGLLAAVRSEGLQTVRSREPREVTLALRWCADPVMWTYCSLHTLPKAASPGGARAGTSDPPAWRVALVEPDPGLRQALWSHLSQHPDCRPLVAWGRAAEVPGGLENSPADLLLVSQVLGEISGADLIARLRHLRPRLVCVEYAAFSDSEELFRSTPGGASAYFLRRTTPDRMLEPLEGCPAPRHGDHGAWMRTVTGYFQRLVGEPGFAPASPRLSRLTPRELEILGLISRGFLDKEIAHRLRISVWTVHGHAKRIFEKLGVHSRTEAAVKYLQK
ncbi:MAG: response regulator transcription factor [Verrucomicrobiae bacterium]|nr:response regulator transcription factor [Verrucomicrobiae bacterium]